MDIRRGDIFYIERYQTIGSEQQAGRPALVVSNDKNNEFSDTVEIVYLTTAPKTDLPTHVTIKSTSKESTALCEQITSVSKMRVGDYMCSASAQEMAQIDIALLISLDLTMSAQKAPVAPTKTPEPTPKPVIEVQPTQGNNATILLEKEIVKLKAQLEIYKGLYEDMTNRLVGRNESA